MSLNNEAPSVVRPRRLEPDTLAYLKEVTESLLTNEQSREKEFDQDGVSGMIWNVLDEITPRIASASSDRHACPHIERLIDKMNAAQIRFFMSQMTQYFSHLWTNRYSSHVLQHILAKASSIINDEVEIESSESLENDETVPEFAKECPSMASIIESMVDEVKTEWVSLMSDISATHVLRSVLHVLAGKPFKIQKRGKRAKHANTIYGVDLEKDVKDETLQVPKTFSDIFRDILMAVVSSEVSTIQDLMYDLNAGPLITSLMQLSRPKARQTLLNRILCWSDEKDLAERDTCKIFFDCAGDPVASHFLEAAFSGMSARFFEKLYLKCMDGNLVEYSEHAISNFVVQHAIAVVSDAALAEKITKELLPVIPELMSMGRHGVIWRLTELCGRMKCEQKAVLLCIKNALEKRQASKPEAAQKDWVSALLSLDLQTSNAKTYKVSMNVMGAKMFHEFLKFEDTKTTNAMLKTLFHAYNPAQLAALACDTTGSRYIIEPIWESKSPERAWAVQALFDKLKCKFGTLAADRLGVFSVMKCYEALSDVSNKEVVVKELVHNEAKLLGSHFAQYALNSCRTYEYKRDINEWKAHFMKQKKISEQFESVLAEESLPKVKTKRRKKNF
uniref:Uncharacterized protein AlNc14C143G7327 n=1 Tax=Albugo laibachii Nc14 TaxID=890382 RepID=F0WLD9_9STRA|nr:conserved hypothetical protein [Albugo laibachii Nc14]|eukprot:CCA22102.1 conserved hypothetical protein [Albugo laibachii Nc14]